MKKIFLLIALLFSAYVNAQILTNFQGKIISKNGMVMAGADGLTFITAQPAALNQVTIVLRIDTGKSILINWGDGNITNATGTGSNVSYTSTYSNSNTTYIIQLTGDLDFVRRFDINEPVKFSSTTQLARLTGLQEFYWNNVDFNSLNIDALPSSLSFFYVNLSSSKGTISGNLSLKPSISTFDIQFQPNTVSGSIAGLTNLTSLRVAGSNTLSGSITGLTNLTSIIVTGANNTITGSITGLTNLTGLAITGANTLSGSVAGLTNLTLLQVEGSNTITGSITGLTSLNSLRVTGSNSISGSVAALNGLTQLYVTGSNTISGSLAGLTNLNFLFVTGSNTLSGSVAGLTALTSLYVTGANTVSGSLSGLTNLATIVLTGNNAVSNPLDLVGLNKLTYLQLQNSAITSFIAPNSTGALTTTYLYNNNIDKFDFTNTVNIQGDLRIYNNPNDTALVLPAVLNGPFTRIDANGNALNQRSVDQLFAKLAAYYATRTPAANLYINISGGTNAAPTGGWSNPDIVALDSKFAASGRVFTLLKN